MPDLDTLRELRRTYAAIQRTFPRPFTFDRWHASVRFHHPDITDERLLGVLRHEAQCMGLDLTDLDATNPMDYHDPDKVVDSGEGFDFEEGDE